jgi:hypothetical protein
MRPPPYLRSISCYFYAYRLSTLPPRFAGDGVPRSSHNSLDFWGKLEGKFLTSGIDNYAALCRWTSPQAADTRL